MPKQTICYILGLLLTSPIAALELHGSVKQGGLLWGRAESGSKVWLDGKAVRVADNGIFVFGFDRDAGAKATLKVCRNDDCQLETLAVAQREYAIQRVDGVPQETVTPPPEVLERIRHESQLMGKARWIHSSRQDFASTFIWPLRGPITGVFGSQRVYNGEPRRPHYGVDVAAPVGTRVVAPAAGKVSLVHEDMFFSGGTLVVDHGQGISSTFIHLNKILVEEGQEVAQGDAIAEVGATGRATGPHLDWRMNWHGERLDPELLVGPMPAAEAVAEK